jgi:hypothetical protein
MMNKNHRKSVIALWLIAVSLFISANAQETKKSKPEPLMIQEQGSFAVGGSVITNSGTSTTGDCLALPQLPVATSFEREWAQNWAQPTGPDGASCPARRGEARGEAFHPMRSTLLFYFSDEYCHVVLPVTTLGG